MSGLPPYEIYATPESVSRWQIGRDASVAPPPQEGTPLALSYLVFLRVQPILGVSIHRLLGRDPDRGLFGGVSYRAARVPTVGERFAASGAVTAKKRVPSAAGELTITTLATRYRDAAGLVVEESVRMIDLPAGAPSVPARGPERQPARPKIAELAPITRTQIGWLAVESGDMNPLHFDTAYAASRLYPDIVVPGTLLAALAEREAVAALGAPLVELDLRLHAPTYPGESLALHGERDGAAIGVELFCGRQLRAEVRARAAVAGK